MLNFFNHSNKMEISEIHNINGLIDYISLERYLPKQALSDICSGIKLQIIAQKLKKIGYFPNLCIDNIYIIISTYAAHISYEKNATTFLKSGVDKYTVHCRYNDDSRPCDFCKRMDGKSFKLSKRKPGINFPPFHNGCHCYFTVSRINIDSHVKKHGGD